MPLYEYRCTECNTDFEELVSPSKTDGKCHAPACPRCKSTKTVRILSAPTVRAGSGSGLGSLGPMSGGGCAPSGGFS